MIAVRASRARRRVPQARVVLYLPRRAGARAIQMMSRAGRETSTATWRVRATLLTLCALLCVRLCALPAWAGRPVHVYEVDVDGQSAPALQGAMRVALVRATGRRESVDDPALAGIIADAAKFVRAYTTGPRGESQVVFDGAAVERAITAAGRTVWDRDRPFTLVVLEPPRARAAEDAARVELERVAAERGLPISLIPLTVVDGTGNLLGADALLQAAQRFGGDQILIGRGEDSGPDTPLQWSLFTRVRSDSWSGPLAAGIDHTVDLLAPLQGTSLAEVESEAQVQVDGVNSLTDYANVERLLQSAPGVRRANVAAADGNSVTFEVTVRGGAAGLEQALGGSRHLIRSGGASAWAQYRYQPQG
jgi:Uncharacterized protein conserved in bacteria (DUF2066)